MVLIALAAIMSLRTAFENVKYGGTPCKCISNQMKPLVNIVRFAMWDQPLVRGRREPNIRALPYFPEVCYVYVVVLCDISYRGKPLLTRGPDCCHPLVSHSGYGSYVYVEV